MDSLLARAAHPVQRNRRDFDRETGFQHCQAGQVCALVANGGDAAPHHILYAAGLYPGALGCRPQNTRT
jgi:hypothetical protein